MNCINIFSLILLSFALISCGNNSSGAGSSTSKESNPIVAEKSAKSELHRILNKFRKNERLISLRRVDIMDATADDHARDMGDGRTPYGHYGVGERCDRIRSQLGSGAFCREIVARNQKSARAAFDSWAASPNALQQLRDPRFSYVGIGVATDSADRVYWTVILLQQ